MFLVGCGMFRTPVSFFPDLAGSEGKSLFTPLRQMLLEQLTPFEGFFFIPLLVTTVKFYI